MLGVMMGEIVVVVSQVVVVGTVGGVGSTLVGSVGDVGGVGGVGVALGADVVGTYAPVCEPFLFCLLPISPQYSSPHSYRQVPRFCIQPTKEFHI